MRSLREDRKYAALVVRRPHDGKVLRTRFAYLPVSHDEPCLKMYARARGYEVLALVRVAFRHIPQSKPTGLTEL